MAIKTIKILIHPSNGTHAFWPSSFIDNLVKEGHYVVTYDQRDGGKSSFVTKEPAPIKLFRSILSKSYFEKLINFLLKQLTDKDGNMKKPPLNKNCTLALLTQDLIELLNYLNINKAHLIGSSIGSVVAQELWVKHPGLVLSLTLMNSSPFMSIEPKTTKDKKTILNYIRNIMLANTNDPNYQTFLTDNNASFFQSMMGLSEDESKSIAKKIQKHGFNPYNSYISALVHGKPLLSSKIPNTTPPTLIFHGDKDLLFPISDANALNKLIPGSTLEVLTDVGHVIPEKTLCEQVFPKLIEHLSLKVVRC